MQDYKRVFAEYMVRNGVLTFGDFVTKSGRRTPYFINTGNYRTGSQLGRLGEFYAAALREHWSNEFDNLYGPAYKGIPLAVSTSIALAGDDNAHNVSVTFNRKELKDHGEGGGLIGHKYAGDERVIIIEDVITAGTSVRESMTLLKANQQPKVTGVLVSVDRMERGVGTRSALQEIEQEFSMPVRAIVTIREIVEILHNKEIDGTVWLGDQQRDQIEAYLQEYGIKSS